MSFLPEFIQNYYQILDKRFHTFYQIFEYLESLNKTDYLIIETGSVRDNKNYHGDGCSTLLFDKYVNYRNGCVRSVDTNSNAVELVQQYASTKTLVHHGDSVPYLHSLAFSNDINHIDLLYLDSFDLNWDNTHPSAFHHFKEMMAIMPKITKGTLIVVDDNENNKGKGEYILNYMNHIGKQPLFNRYQIGWIW